MARHDRNTRQSRAFALVFEDDDIIVVDKAAGVLTVPTPRRERFTLVDELSRYLSRGPRITRRAFVVHRLDRDTSGVLLFARNGDMRDRLKDLFASHDLTRIYSAVIHGALRPASGTFRSYLLEDPASLRVRSIANKAQGREAITHYRTIASNGRFTLLDVTLETGRRHQIRVHFAEAGHPVMGDAIYGPWMDNPLGRLGLHARHLSFVHPRSGERVSFDVPPPPEFAQVVR